MNPKSPIKSYKYNHFKATNMFFSKYSIVLLVIYWYKIKFHRRFSENWCSKCPLFGGNAISRITNGVSCIEILEGQGPFGMYVAPAVFTVHRLALEMANIENVRRLNN